MKIDLPTAIERLCAAWNLLCGATPGAVRNDVLREREQEQRHLRDLELIAFHDSLTGLPNRRRLQDVLCEALQRCALEPSHEFSLLFLDFDRFKLINDTLGHAAGDQFLVRVSRMLQEQLRPHDLVARLGGDEFAILVQGEGCTGYSVVLADRLLKLLSQPVLIDKFPVSATASIGITSSRVGYADAAGVLRDADIAMYRAKAAGKARYAVFDVALRQEMSERLILEGNLREAIARRELHLEYQPIFQISPRKLVGFEALLRWQHPRLGCISPARFIPIAEESGLVIALTDFVLEEASHQLRRLKSALPDGESLVMHVNISGNDLDGMAFAARVKRACACAGLEPRDLVLELTENIITSRLQQALPMLRELRALGFGVSVDDFGTGNSSLAHLSRLPMSSLKIDRSFIADLDEGTNTAIVRAIVLLGKALGLKVIAEGIETRAQFLQLQALGCEAAQGYYLSAAVTAEALMAMCGGEVRQPRLAAAA